MNNRIACSFQALVFLLVILCFSGNGQAAEFWEYAPYKIRIVLKAEAPPFLEARSLKLSGSLEERCDITAGALWKTEIILKQFQEKFLEATPPNFNSEKTALPKEWLNYDKVIFLSVKLNIGQSNIVAREFDVRTRRWGPVSSYTARQNSEVSRLAYTALKEAFSPVATFRMDPKNKSQMKLSIQGQAIMPGTDDFTWMRKGDVLVPILRKNDRDGMPRPGGIFQVPWTFLVIESDQGTEWKCSVQSGNKRPFGLRRSGRVEQIALLARPSTNKTTLRLITKTEFRTAMPGCRFYEKTDKKGAFQLVGISDSEGKFIVEESAEAIRMLWIKSGEFLLAKVPVVPGYQPEIDVPLPDDKMRLKVEGTLIRLRSELIDVVARRNILMTRIRVNLDAGNKTEAKKLFQELDDLPKRQVFSAKLEQQARLLSTKDDVAQKRIDALFAKTKIVLGTFLDQKEISDIESKISNAGKADTLDE